MFRRFAARVKQQTTYEQSQVVASFQLAFQREPSKREAEAGTRLMREAGLAHLCRMLLNANEFVTLE